MRRKEGWHRREPVRMAAMKWRAALCVAGGLPRRQRRLDRSTQVHPVQVRVYRGSRIVLKQTKLGSYNFEFYLRGAVELPDFEAGWSVTGRGAQVHCREGARSAPRGQSSGTSVPSDIGQYRAVSYRQVGQDGCTRPAIFWNLYGQRTE